MQLIKNLNFDCDLDFRVIDREDNSIDIFIETDNRTVNIYDEGSDFFDSRIQFPRVRIILLRLSKNSTLVTVHLLRDIDLLSAFANFEVDYRESILSVKNNHEYIIIKKAFEKKYDKIYIVKKVFEKKI
ncbi:hypothetical protein [Peptostreptococcus canis]|uniref:Immunity protein 50 n=1 Tax=Peptostreptococcus canis TaxID=1159213 RepID=A0ABR6TIX4_9FIRM|nr:hypothetical protein [Peptostreptococcus canis]MBC2575347.1 hypothetical protein [Peptostreptococcus canis]MBP1997470.1 hypothetical protein [Peptostreptococcus canis]